MYSVATDKWICNNVVWFDDDGAWRGVATRRHRDATNARLIASYF